MLKTLKTIKRLKAVLNGDIIPEAGECPGFSLPAEVDEKDVRKKLLRYYYTTDHGVPMGKAETSRDIPEMQHEYVLPVRMKIGDALVACREAMRTEVRAQERKLAGGLLAVSVLVSGVAYTTLGTKPFGKALLVACALLAVFSFVKIIKTKK